MPKENKPVAGQLGVVIKNVIPLRGEPKDDSEQVSQALLGQPVIIEGGSGDWLFVQTWDTYRGWIHERAVRALDDQNKAYASAGPVAVIRELFVDVMSAPRLKSEIITKATVSNELEVADMHGNWVQLRMPDGKEGFIQAHEAKLIDKDMPQAFWLPGSQKLVETAIRFIGVPYLWGGTSPFGMDCSGFVQLVYKINNVTLLRDAGPQAGDPRAERVEVEELQAGDLVFFGKGTEPDTKVITHIGMMVDKKRFIHCCGHSGTIIANLADGHNSTKYWGARRMRLETLDAGGGAPED
jgi:SH3-like domain-containing protein